jgi:hypothetical protein
MLRAYYDVNESDSFDTLFDDLWIKEHPTAEKCGYQVMYLDFSRVKHFTGWVNIRRAVLAIMASPRRLV